MCDCHPKRDQVLVTEKLTSCRWQSGQMRRKNVECTLISQNILSNKSQNGLSKIEVLNTNCSIPLNDFLTTGS